MLARSLLRDFWTTNYSSHKWKECDNYLRYRVLFNRLLIICLLLSLPVAFASKLSSESSLNKLKQIDDNNQSRINLCNLDLAPITGRSKSLNDGLSTIYLLSQIPSTYPFWVQCSSSNNNQLVDHVWTSSNNIESSSPAATNSTNYINHGLAGGGRSFVVYSKDYPIPLATFEQMFATASNDTRYRYLADVARDCEVKLSQYCQTIRIGLMSQETDKYKQCGKADSNCENVHQCTDQYGFIKSVNYPYNYGNNHRCRWSIKAPDTYYVNLSIIDFDIPSTNNATKLSTCVFDYLTIIDGYSGKLLGRYCNENLPPVHTVSPWNELIIQFDTNSDTAGRGFYFNYRFMQLKLDSIISQQLKLSISQQQQQQDSSSFQKDLATNLTIGILSGASNNNNPATTAANNNNLINLNQQLNNNLCPHGWEYFRENCYKAFSELEPLQWYDAEDKCNNVHGLGRDGHLVSILDKEEMLVILYLLTHAWKSPRYHDYYIGLIDVTREGVYRWSDNNPMSYTDWQLHPILIEEEFLAQPDGGAYEDCTIIRYNSYSGTSNWHDVPCSLGKHFHSFSDRSGPLSTNWQYVNSYICKSDSFATGSSSKSQARRPLFTMKQQKQHTPGSNEVGYSRHHTTTSTISPSTIYHQTSSFISPNMGDRSFIENLDFNKYFLCDNLEVISTVLRCDGIAHCRDGSDESSASCDQDCLPWQFKCANNRCIPIGSYCDFVDDCGDGSDESRCERARCKLNEFKCQSGQCIPASKRCDLLQDCMDASDEGKLCTIGSNCNTGSTFQCYNGNCIPNYTVCDFQIDCPGKFHEDEDVATCELVTKNRTLEYRSNYPQIPNYHSWPIAYYEIHSSLTIDPLQYAIGLGSGANNQADQFTCASGNTINNSLRCLYEFDQYGYQQGCRDVSHLLNCKNFECPQKDYVKCRNSYCIPWRYICDGKWDCVSGDDEVGCARYICPAQYKCANQSSCILPHQLCDNQRQCPMGDDEWFCDLNCPPQCECIGRWVSCKGANLTDLPANYVSKSVRKLDLGFNRLGPSLMACNFSAYHDLGELILDHNQIESLVPRKFSQLRNLYKLDLSNNQLTSLRRGAFAGLRRVTQLLLESNPDLQFLEPEAFLDLKSLQILNISSSRILTLKKNTFDGLTSLRHLLLQNNMIVEIEDGAFRSLNSLVTLDMRGNEIRHFTKLIFSDLKSLRNLSTDSFKFCCLVNKKIPTDRCLPLPDEISDCEDLLSSPIQRTCIWLAGGISVVGNLLGIACTFKDRQRERKEDRVNSTLLLSLGCSDLLMGIYLIIIAAVDFHYRGIYIENSDNWRDSLTCNFCGYLSTVSSIVSLFTLVLIALNRYAEICKPFDSPSKFTLGYTHKIILCSWFVAIVIATIPLLISDYFRGNFYSKNGVCLAFHITNQKPPGWLYSMIVFQGLNLVAFVIIVRCYTLMYLNISRVSLNLAVPRAKRSQVKILIIITISFIAWSPTIILRLMTLAGIGLPAAVYSWIAVTVLPVNSAINPWIYTMPSIRGFIKTFLRIYRSKNAKFMARMTSQHHQQQHSGAGASDATTANEDSFHNWRAAKELRSLLTANSELRKRLAERNIPSGYQPIKQYIRNSKEPLKASQMARLALDIIRDLEEKHQAMKVYATLNLDSIYVSDCIDNKPKSTSTATLTTTSGLNENHINKSASIRLTTNSTPTQQQEERAKPSQRATNSTSISKTTPTCNSTQLGPPITTTTATQPNYDNDNDKEASGNAKCTDDDIEATHQTSGQRQLSLFIADHDGYRPKSYQQCNHNQRVQKPVPDCECADVDRFGDLMLKLIQCCNNRRIDTQRI